jgi:tetratricopeptide (TPR) repeat protein
VVPRWRDFATTAALGEIGPGGTAQPRDPLPTDLEEVKKIWITSRNPLTAGELLAGGLLQKDWEAVFDAATYLTRNDVKAPPIGQDIAKRALIWLRTREAFPVDPLKGENAVLFDPRIIGAIRRSLGDLPDDPIHWMELALAYAIIGKEDKAYKAVTVALNLAPNDRFVLRCASRFFVHHHQPERAAHILGQATRTPFDSWLLAAHVAISEIIDKPSRFYRKAKHTFDSADISPLHLSELGAALATSELYSGNDKKARRLFGKALVAPTENTVAQMLWATNFLSIGQQQHFTSVPRSFEANARILVQAEKWDNALDASIAWFEDEPFSARPAMLGSAIAASALENFKQAETIARRGLVSNPSDHGLINNLAFALACADNVTDASLAIAQVRGEPKTSLRVALTATEGLIAFRSGDAALGREKYLDAIQLAKENDLFIQQSIAAIFLARETLRIDSVDLDDSLDRVREALPNISVPSVNLALSKLNDELEAKERATIEPVVENKVREEAQVIQLPPTDAPWLRM